MKTLDIYTDGACSKNPGPGGYGIVLLYNGIRKEISEGFKETTNNRMEILAIIVALETLKESCIINLYSDSKYVIDSLNRGWAVRWKENNWMKNKTEKALNIDLWERLLELIKKHKVNFIWVKGHSNNIENERCDYLARNAIKNSILKDDINYNKRY